MRAEPLKIYYPICLIICLMPLFPLSLLLAYRLYTIFIRKEPGIYPDCENWGMKAGKFLLTISKFLAVFALVVLGGTFILSFIAPSGSMSGVPAGLAMVLVLMLIIPSVVLIELSQFNHRREILKDATEVS